MAQKNGSKGNASKEESTSLVSQETSSGENLPAFMQDHKSEGKENIERGDLVIPRVALMQSVHKEVEEGKADAGNFYHTILEEDLGQSIEDLIIIHHSKRYMLWNPRHAGGGILARADDGKRWNPPFQNQEFEVAPLKDRPKYKVKWETGVFVGRDQGLGAWGTSDPENPDSPPAATLVHVLVCVIASRLDLGPFVILLQRSAEPVGKNLVTKISLDAAPIYGQVYSLGQKIQGSPSGDFFQYTFTKNGHVRDEGMFHRLREEYQKFASMEFKYDDSDEDPETVAATGGDAAGVTGANDKY
jgi:hypothetical protein